jgi:hypothetical protein
VHFLIAVDATRAMPCICARCRGQGLRIAYGNADTFRLITGQENLTENFAEARTPHHFFCRTCGEAVFGRNRAPDGSETISVNITCLERSHLDALADGLTIDKDDAAPGTLPDERGRHPVSK